MIETVDSMKLADLLNQKWANISSDKPLKVLVQVNTSSEEGFLMPFLVCMNETIELNSSFFFLSIPNSKKWR